MRRLLLIICAFSLLPTTLFFAPIADAQQLVEADSSISDTARDGPVLVTTGQGRLDLAGLPVRTVAEAAALLPGYRRDLDTGALALRANPGVPIAGGQEINGAFSTTTAAPLERVGRTPSVLVDGVRVQDEQLMAPFGSIRSIEALHGFVPGSYGQAAGGLVLVETARGGSAWSGGVEALTSESLDPYGYSLGSATVRGPLATLGTFALAGEWKRADDALPYGIASYRLTDEAYANLLANPQLLQFVNPDDDSDVQYVQFPWEAVAGSDELLSSEDLLSLLGDDVPEGYELASERPIDAPNTYTAETAGVELERGKDDPLQNLTFNGSLSLTPAAAFSLRLGGAYGNRDREIFNFTNSLYNRDRFYNDERESYRFYGTFRQRVSDNAFYELRGEFQDYRRDFYPEGFSSDVEDLTSYGDIDGEYGTLASRYYTYGAVDRDGDGQVDGEGYLRLYDEDGASRPSSVVGTFGLPGAVLTQYLKQHNQQFRISGSATAQLGVHQLEFGAEYEQETRRQFRVSSGRSLARLIDDEDGPEQTIAGLPEGSAADYSEIPFRAFRDISDSFGFRYGYNFNGTEEVDDQDVDGYFARTNTNLAPYKPTYQAGYVRDRFDWGALSFDLGLRVEVYNPNATALLDPFVTVPVTRAGDLDGAPEGIGEEYAAYFNDTGTVVGYRDLDGNFYDASGNEATSSVITGALSGSLQGRTGAPFNEPRSSAFARAPTHTFWQPRLKARFALSDQASLFSYYSRAASGPPAALYLPFNVYEEGFPQYSPARNVHPEPFTVTALGMGGQWHIPQAITLTPAFFYRQQRDLSDPLSTSNIRFLIPPRLSEYGIDLTAERSRAQGLSFVSAYTLAGARVDPGGLDAVAPFDIRHTLDMAASYRLPRTVGPQLGGVALLGGSSIGATFVFQSGRPYTALSSLSPDGSSFTSPGINEVRLPAVYQLDLRLDKRFALGTSTLDVFVWVENVLGAQNVLAVYRATEQPDTDGYLDTPVGQNYLDGQLDPGGAEFNYRTFIRGPLNLGGNQTTEGALFYGQPRQVRVGLRLEL